MMNGLNLFQQSLPVVQVVPRVMPAILHGMPNDPSLLLMVEPKQTVERGRRGQDSVDTKGETAAAEDKMLPPQPLDVQPQLQPQLQQCVDDAEDVRRRRMWTLKWERSWNCAADVAAAAEKRRRVGRRRHHSRRITRF
jgi:hypothetical protein